MILRNLFTKIFFLLKFHINVLLNKYNLIITNEFEYD